MDESKAGSFAVDSGGQTSEVPRNGDGGLRPLPAERQEALLRALTAISGTFKMQPLLTLILREACGLFDATIGSVGLVDEGREMVRIRAAHGLLESALNVDIPFGVGLAGEVVRARQILRLPRYDLLPHPMFQNVGDHAVLGAPLIYANRVVAYLGVGVPPPRHFDEVDGQILGAFARHAAVVLEATVEVELACREAVTDDRQILANYLHEAARGRLGVISMRAQLIDDAWERSPAEGRRQTAETLLAIREAIGNIRKLVRELRRPDDSPPGALPKFIQERLHDELDDGLPAALERLAKRRTKSSLRVNFVPRHYTAQPAEVEEALLQIAQEALSNVVRHARARTADILLSQEGSLIGLKVVDDGAGFNLESWRDRLETRGKCGIGLAGMKELAESLRGELRVFPRTGGGTVIQVSLPGRGGDAP